MSLISTTCPEEQYNRNNHSDGNNSDDSLLLMTDDMEEQAPLLNILDDDLEGGGLISSTDIPLRPRLTISHCHVPEEKFDYVARNRLIAVLILCIIFMIIEIIGGILSNSTAVATDAAHMCIDATSFLISLIALYLGRKRPTQRLSYGYIRAEILGALVSVMTIWVATGILVYMAIGRCIDTHFEVKAPEMIIVSSCGVVFNIVMFFVLHANMCGQTLPHHGHSHGGHHNHSHGDDHGHSHHHNHSHDNQSLSVEIAAGHQHQTPSSQTRSSTNINVRAAIIHVIGDFIQSVGVLIAAILIKLKPEYKLADPICTFVFSILVLITTITIMRDIVVVLMEGVPSNVSYARIVDDLLRLPNVRNAHSLHIWSLSLQKTALSVHLAIDDDRNCSQVLNEAQEMLRRDHSITHSTIQTEVYNEEMVNSCETCRRPGT